MDSATGLSAAEAARRLGTSTPRVKRAIDRLALAVERRPGGRVRIDDEQLNRLRDELGSGAPAAGFTRAQTAVLAALSRAPLGLVSARAVARRAGISPTSAAAAVEALVVRGLVERTPARIAAGRARDVHLLQAACAGARWHELAPALSGVRPPALHPVQDEVVPDRLHHLFWNTAPAQLEVGRAGGSIARRLLQSGDPEGLAWGAAQLRPADWEHASRTRGLDARTRRLAHNLADAAGGFAATRIGDGVLDGVLHGAKVQFLHARGQARLAPTRRVAGIPVAAVEDILAMKLKVIGDRGELRDYFDVMAIEQQLGRTAEEGIALYLRRFCVPAEHESVRHILLGLGYLDDVDDDDLLPVGRDAIERYWRRRQPQVVRNASRFG